MAGGSLNRGGVNKVIETLDAAQVTLLAFNVQPDSIATFKLAIRAMDKATGDAAFFQFVGGLKRPGSGDAEVVTLVPNNPPAAALMQNFTDLEGGSKDVQAWDAIVELSGAGVVVKVTGTSGAAITWNALLLIDQFILN